MTKKLAKQRDRERVLGKRYKLACAPIEDTDQPAHPHSLIRDYDGHSMVAKGRAFLQAENEDYYQTVPMRRLIYAHANLYLDWHQSTKCI